MIKLFEKYGSRKDPRMPFELDLEGFSKIIFKINQ